MLIVPSPAVLPAWSRWNILRRDARLQLQLVAAPYDPWVGWGGVDCASGKLSARAREQARKRANEQTSKRARRGAHTMTQSDPPPTLKKKPSAKRGRFFEHHLAESARQGRVMSVLLAVFSRAVRDGSCLARHP